VRSKRTSLQVTPDHGDEHQCPRGNGYLSVNLSRNTHDGFRKGQDVVFGGHTWDTDCRRVESQDFLYESRDQPSVQFVNMQAGCGQTFPTATKYGMESKSFTLKSLSPLTLIFSRVPVISARSFAWMWRFLANSQRPNANYGLGYDRLQPNICERLTVFATLSWPATIIVLNHR